MRTREQAIWLGRHSVVDPFRQTEVLATHRFVSFLKNRGINLQSDHLHHFARCGVLLPVAVRSQSPLRSRRYPPIATTSRWRLYGDRGGQVRVADLRRWPKDSRYDHELLWHPFQVWQVERVMEVLHQPVRINPITVLRGPPTYGRFASRSIRAHQPAARLRGLVEGPAWKEFETVLSVLVAVEPLVSLDITGRISLHSTPGEESLGRYDGWRSQFDPDALLGATRAGVELLRRWHEHLAGWADLKDPVAAWRVLVRYAPRDMRLRFRGDALLAEDGYYMAEVIRRYLAGHHGVEDLPDEDRVRSGPQVERFKEEYYGKRTTTDGDRSVFRNVARQFGVDPQPRVRWLIEGATENGFIRRWAELLRVDLDRAGIELIEVNIGDLKPKGRGQTLLEVSRDEEVFVVLTIDGDNDPDRPRQLLRFVKQGLLPAGWTLFDRDFEEGNFSLAELAEAANAHAAEARCEMEPVTEADIVAARRMNEPVGKTIERLLRARHCYAQKGAEWGRRLADLIFDRPNGRERPIVNAFVRAMGGAESNYRFTQRFSSVQPDGTLASGRCS